MNRRGFVSGLLAMPAIIRTPGLLMPVSVQRPQRLRGWVACSLFDDTGYAPWPDGTWLRHYDFTRDMNHDYGMFSGMKIQSMEITD